MKAKRQKRLAADGWSVGSARDFVGLSAAEAMLIEIKLALAGAVRARRIELGWTQTTLALELGSSQSRVAKLEVGDPSVSVDLLLSALASLGVTRRGIAKILASRAA